MNFNFDVNTIAQALRDGSSQEEIANSFAAILNKASATVKQERAIQKQKENEKMKMAEIVAEFYNTYYPEMFAGSDKATADAIIKACESIKNIAVAANKITAKIPKSSAENPLFHIFDL